MQTLTKERIKESFSRAATTYDEAAGFQREIGVGLIERILSEDTSLDMVLDVGMGTGGLTQEFSKRLGRPIYGCDIAWGMVSFSKKNTKDLFINQADIEDLPYKEGIFDLVFSNIAYQWICDLKKAFFEVKRVLKRGGRFYFSVLAKGSLEELYEILDKFFKIGLFRNFFPTEECVKEKLKEVGLDIVWVDEALFRRHYNSCLELLRSMKRVGAGKELEPNLFGMGKRGLFFDMVERYNSRFREQGKVFATYKVILGCVEKL